MSERNTVTMDECFWIKAPQWCAWQKKKEKKEKNKKERRAEVVSVETKSFRLPA